MTDTSRNLILFDLDGTLALIDHRRHLLNGTNDGWRAFYAACPNDVVNPPVFAMWNILRQAGYELWIVSGRSDEVQGETFNWLWTNRIEADKVLMRSRNDHRPDVKLKRQWLQMGEIPKERVLCVFDDRKAVVDMWREEGLPCFQVAPGDF